MDLREVLIKHRSSFRPVVPFDAARDKLLRFDFSEKNLGLRADMLNNLNEFIDFVNQKLQRAHAVYGVGGYAENRSVYSGSKVFDNPDGGEPRRFHLGIDIWGRPLTKVMAPLDAVVHSHGYNNNFGDYGATIILSHVLDGLSFHTLYGHLSLNSLKNLRDGETICAGDVFAEFGIPAENGHWPPHLHFQIIKDLEGHRGDYPGVCALSQKDQYLQNCPDPDLILGMMQYAVDEKEF